MVSVLNREQKEQDQKAAIEPSDEIGRRARRKRDRWKCHHFVTLNTHRKSGVLGCSRHALAHPGLLPPLLPQQPARYCRRAAEGKQKEAVVLQDGWKDTTASTRAKAFLGQEDMLLLVQIDCHCWKWRSVCSHWKVCSTLGKGPSPSTQPLHPHRCITDCQSEGEMEMVLPSRHIVVVIEQRMNVKLERNRNLLKSKGNKPDFH